MDGLTPNGRCWDCNEEVVGDSLFCGLRHAENWLKTVQFASPSLAPDAQRLFTRAMTIFADRAKRYGTDNIVEAGPSGVLARIRDKLARAENLLDEGTPEMAIDTALDLANYGIILASLASGDWPREQKTVKVIGSNMAPPALPGDVGYDLRASRETYVYRNGTTYVPTDTRLLMPPKTWCTIVGRSSLLKKRKSFVPPCVIDTDYTGLLEVCVHNFGDSYNIEVGERIAQVVFHKAITPTIEPVDSLPLTPRGNAGFGSTGR
jgi:dUTP pyrophosphatase